MPTQKSLILPVKQGNWEINATDIPTPGPQEVLVKIVATGLNPVDWKIQTYGYIATNFPFISGVDAAGIVEEVGADVSNLRVAKGDRILFQGWFENHRATFQQYAVVAAEITAKIPENISFDQAASIPSGLVTAFMGIWNKNPEASSVGFPAPWEAGGETKFAGKPAFILGGASSVGQYVIQLARVQKFSPIIATASPHNETLLKSLGATHVVDRSLAPDAILSEIQKITGGTPVEYVYDAISTADTQSLAYQALAPGGALLLLWPDAIPEDLKADADGKRIVHVFGSVDPPFNRKISVEVYSRLTEWLKDGVIVPNKVEVLPNGLAGIPDGLNRLKENKVSGTKLVAHPQETA